MALEIRGHRSLQAADAEEALALFKARGREIQAVITDLHMPGLDGMSLARELMGLRPGLPVAISSGAVTEDQSQEFGRAGIRALLVKPYTGAQLTACIGALLRDVPLAAVA